ncbi:sugar kinase [Sporosarcina saromensis]|uniref:Sugar kinase n=1 Tax=Sporosarcina saromensis TaxID=359365 RepID=A0ABU4G9M0_9BACL|nr:sugar kinase [Sporosarcina saromensis]MDW0113087.1 sugar kinase [Sporosarcina saromensis]
MDVLTIGESMVVLSPKNPGAMRYSTDFTRFFAGAESNVAIALTRLGHSVKWVSQVGNDEFGTALLSFIRGEGVDTSLVKVSDSGPTGLLFKEIRHSNDIRVHYYRDGSAASHMQPDSLKEDQVTGLKVFHVTGITPGLSDSAYQLILQVLEWCKKHAVTVIFDPNIRAKFLKQPTYLEKLQRILHYTDVFIPNTQEAVQLLNVHDMKEQVDAAFSYGIGTVIIKDGQTGAYYFTDAQEGFVPHFDVEIVDSVGAGDAFAAGIISGILDDLSWDEIVRRANALGALAITAVGDITNLPNRNELDEFMKGNRADNVRR